MKRCILLCSLLLAICNLPAQVAPTTTTEYQLSTGGIGPFKIGMPKAAIEKLLNTKLNLPKSSLKDSYELDTIKVTYKEVDLQLVFQRAYFGNDTAIKQGVYSIASSSPLVKTKSGISIGDDKIKIVKTYEQYRLDILPEWIDGKPNPKRGTVTLFDNENPKVIIFYLDNNIVTRVETTQYEGD
jgi:hypothetical protein